jgi:hypothetical protein
MAGLGVGVVSVVDGDELGDELTAGLVVVVVVVSVVDGDCAVRLEHAANPLLKKMAAIANPPHIFGENVAGFAILLRFSTGAALPTTEDLYWLRYSVIIFRELNGMNKL